jgi:hypothetical protein
MQSKDPYSFVTRWLETVWTQKDLQFNYGAQDLLAYSDRSRTRRRFCLAPLVGNRCDDPTRLRILVGSLPQRLVRLGMCPRFAPAVWALTWAPSREANTAELNRTTAEASVSASASRSTNSRNFSLRFSAPPL